MGLPLYITSTTPKNVYSLIIIHDMPFLMLIWASGDQEHHHVHVPDNRGGTRILYVYSEYTGEEESKESTEHLYILASETVRDTRVKMNQRKVSKHVYFSVSEIRPQPSDNNDY